MTRRKARLIAVLALGTLAPPAACAAPAAPPAFGYALSAVGFPSFYVFDSHAGQTVRGVLRVVDLTPTPKTILLYSGSVRTAASGGLEYDTGFHTGVAKWVELSRRSVRLSGREHVDVPFRVKVPAGVRAGDLFGSIVAIDQRVLAGRATGHGAIQLRIVPRLAMTIQLRTPGRRTAELTVGAASIQVAPSGASLALHITNFGNTLIPAATGELTISQGSTVLFSRTIELAAFVPRTHITLQVPWAGRPVEGTYSVKGLIRPSGAPAVRFQRTVVFTGTKIRQYRSQTGRQATAASTPAWLIAALAVAVILVLVLAATVLRLRRR